LEATGADQVLVDSGSVADQIKQAGLFDKVLELVGTTTLLDSLQCVSAGGSVCMTGMVGNMWTLEDFSPMGCIPHAVNLTTYSGGPEDFKATPLEDLVRQIAGGRLKVPIGKVFSLDDIVEAHATMEENRAGGKIVVMT